MTNYLHFSTIQPGLELSLNTDSTFSEIATAAEIQEAYGVEMKQSAAPIYHEMFRI